MISAAPDNNDVFCLFLELTMNGSKSLQLAIVRLCTSCSQKVGRESRAGILEQSMGARNQPWQRFVIPAHQAKYRLVSRYHNPTSTRFPAPTDCSKIPALQCAQAISHRTRTKYSSHNQPRSEWLSASMSVHINFLSMLQLHMHNWPSSRKRHTVGLGGGGGFRYIQSCEMGYQCKIVIF